MTALRKYGGTALLMVTTVAALVALVYIRPAGPIVALALVVCAFYRGHDLGYEHGVKAGRAAAQAERADRDAKETQGRIGELAEHYRRQRATDPAA